MQLLILPWIIMIWRMHLNKQKFVEMTKVKRNPKAEFDWEHINKNRKLCFSCSQRTLHVNDGPTSDSEHRKRFMGSRASPPPSEVYSPPAPPRPVRMGLGHTSPMSDLALHPSYRAPGRDFLSDHTAYTEETLPNQTSPNSFDESN